MGEADRRKWDERYGGQEGPSGEAASLLDEVGEALPRHGRALDVAGGSGRNAVWLARRGLDVTVADISPAGLALARRRAREAEVELRTLEVDFDAGPFPPGPWDVILSFQFLWRELFDHARRELAPGGWLVYAQPTRSNLQRHEKPSARYLLDDGELPKLVRDLDIVYYQEGWTEEGRHEAHLVARKPSA